MNEAIFQKRIKNVKDKVTIVQVLKDYKLYPFTYEVEDFQMRCPFHGNGKETHPSSHVYAPSDDNPYQKFICFTCGKNFDVIAFVQEKEGIEDFTNVLQLLERRYNLPKIAYNASEVQKDIFKPYEPEKFKMEPRDMFRILEKQIISLKNKMTVDKYSKFFYVLDSAFQNDRVDQMALIQEKIKELKNQPTTL